MSLSIKQIQSIITEIYKIKKATFGLFWEGMAGVREFTYSPPYQFRAARYGSLNLEDDAAAG
jgi:hypothetical protein